MNPREAIRRIGATKLRLTDAVVMAAAALLLLKAVSIFAHEPAAPSVARAPAPVAAAPAPGAESPASEPPPSVVWTEPDLPDFARVLAYARTEERYPQVISTGSNPGAERAQEEGATADGFGPDLVPSGPAAAPSSQAVLLERMAAQREELDRRLRELDMREELVATAERRLEERGGGVPGTAAAGAAENGGPSPQAPPEALGRLVAMYQAMRPKDAARVFDRLSLDVLVPIVEEMNPRTMAEVMALMSSEAAERLTVALSMRARGMPIAGRTPPTTNSLPSTELQAIELPVRP